MSQFAGTLSDSLGKTMDNRHQNEREYIRYHGATSGEHLVAGIHGLAHGKVINIVHLYYCISLWLVISPINSTLVSDLHSFTLSIISIILRYSSIIFKTFC